MPSPRPVKPSRSVVVALTLTWLAAAADPRRCWPPSAACTARASAPARSSSHRRCPAHTGIARALPDASQQHAAVGVLVRRRRVSGKCTPMSPAPMAPRTASQIACSSTSASECPSSPRSNGTSTPPSTRRRPGDQRVHVEAVADARCTCCGHRASASALAAPVIASRQLRGSLRGFGHLDVRRGCPYTRRGLTPSASTACASSVILVPSACRSACCRIA